MAKVKNIAIDGPVASGKSSVGLELATRLGYLFLDTGIMYRAVTWAAIHAKLDVHDENSVSKLVSNLKIEINKPTKNDGRINDVLIDGVDITNEVTRKYVNDNVSQISKYKQVRKVLTDLQRQISKQGNIVMVGRDIGTVVLPDADLKIFLVASAKERAKRRYQEELEKNPSVTFDDILINIEMRDSTDTTRQLAPLIKADDAIEIETDGMTKDKVVEKILSYIK